MMVDKEGKWEIHLFFQTLIFLPSKIDHWIAFLQRDQDLWIFLPVLELDGEKEVRVEFIFFKKNLGPKGGGV